MSNSQSVRSTAVNQKYKANVTSQQTADGTTIRQSGNSLLCILFTYPWNLFCFVFQLCFWSRRCCGYPTPLKLALQNSPARNQRWAKKTTSKYAIKPKQASSRGKWEAQQHGDAKKDCFKTSTGDTGKRFLLQGKRFPQVRRNAISAPKTCSVIELASW